MTAIADPRQRQQAMGRHGIACRAGSFNLPGGDFSFALGYEHRDESTDFNPGAFYFGGADPDPRPTPAATAIRPTIRVQFGRSIADLPGVRAASTPTSSSANCARRSCRRPTTCRSSTSLELHGAARYVRSSDRRRRSGPVRSAAAGRRSATSRSAATTRARSAPGDQRDLQPVEPGSSASRPTRATRDSAGQRARSGDPTGELRRGRACRPTLPVAVEPAIFPAGASSATRRSRTSGRDAWSVGAVVTPALHPGPDDLGRLCWTSSCENAISRFSATQAVHAAATIRRTIPGKPFCDRVTRDATGQLDFVADRASSTPPASATRACWRDLRYRIATPFLGADSRIGRRNLGSVSDELTTLAAEMRAGQSRRRDRLSRHRRPTSANYKNGPFNLLSFVQLHRRGGARAERARQVPRFNDVDANVFINVAMAYTSASRYQLADGGRQHPRPGPARSRCRPIGGVVTYFPGVLGRYFRIGGSVSF